LPPRCTSSRQTNARTTPGTAGTALLRSNGKRSSYRLYGHFD
jgi:hypothetical protein